jgi:hypothetical protein
MHKAIHAYGRLVAGQSFNEKVLNRVWPTRAHNRHTKPHKDAPAGHPTYNSFTVKWRNREDRNIFMWQYVHGITTV